MTIKNFTDNTIHATDLPIATRIVRAKAAQEHLDQVTKVLEKDHQMLDDIYRCLGIQNEEELWSTYPTSDAHASVVDLHTSYLNLLARSILRSSSCDFSEATRLRFGISGFIVKPETANLSVANVSLLRSKFINLWSIHGVIKRPSILQRFMTRILSIFNKMEIVRNGQVS